MPNKIPVSDNKLEPLIEKASRVLYLSVSKTNRSLAVFSKLSGLTNADSAKTMVTLLCSNKRE